MVAPVEFLPDFKWPVPLAFEAPLEKRKLSCGDIFYDHSDAYVKTWDEALRSVEMGLRVIRATSFEVQFSVLKRNSEKMGLVGDGERTFTYGELYQFLVEQPPFRFTELWKRAIAETVVDEQA